jgi:hypothetical protein
LGEKTERKIIGKWSITKIESSEYKMSDAKNYGTKLMQKLSADFYFIFNADGTFGMKYGSEKSGKWSVTSDGKKMIKTQNSFSDTLEILYLDKSQLKLKGKRKGTEIFINLQKVKMQ